MSRTVRTSPLLIFVSVLVGGSLGAMIGGALGAFFGALFAVPTAACLQILLREAWRLTAGGDGDPAQSSTALQVDAEPQASMESSASTDGAK
ncbi:MAG: hypothetical protein JO075_07005 [Acidimicrobiia bacterium]|nr:hypothetical protein [Acidimicrobiia bacterium]